MIELVAGGARSGKSDYALRIAEGLSGRPVFVATAEARDSAMRQRIERHQQKRSADWSLVEAPLDLASVVKDHDREDVLLIDCLTLWLTNWLCSAEDEAGDEAREEGWLTQKAAFIETLGNTNSDVIMVTNEVGQGVIPLGQLSRDFVDHAGWLHQEVAAIADNVTLVTFGLPQYLKRIAR